MSLEQYLKVTRIFLTVISFFILRSVFKIPHFSPTLRLFLYFLPTLIWTSIVLISVLILDLFSLYLIDLLYPPSNPLVNEDINQLFYNFPISEAELIEIIEEIIIKEREQAKRERYVWIILPSIFCCVTFTICYMYTW